MRSMQCISNKCRAGIFFTAPLSMGCHFPHPLGEGETEGVQGARPQTHTYSLQQLPLPKSHLYHACIADYSQQRAISSTKCAWMVCSCCVVMIMGAGNAGEADAGLASPLEVYQGLAADGYQVSYRRVPLSRERTPEAADLDVLHQQLMTQPVGMPLACPPCLPPLPVPLPVDIPPVYLPLCCHALCLPPPPPCVFPSACSPACPPPPAYPLPALPCLSPACPPPCLSPACCYAFCLPTFLLVYPLLVSQL